MEQATLGWLNFAVLGISSLVFSVMYVLSVRPAHLEQRIGEQAYRRCGQYRLFGTIPMGIASVNYVLYHWYPLPIDPLPARFPWPYWVNVVITVVLGIPALALIQKNLSLISFLMGKWNGTRMHTLDYLQQGTPVKEIAAGLRISDKAVYKTIDAGNLELIMEIFGEIEAIINESLEEVQ